MKTKRTLTLLAVLLMVAMLLPLASCAPSGQTGIGATEGTPTPTTEIPITTESPTGEQSTPSDESSEGEINHPKIDTVVPHTEELLALQAECESRDEAWKKLICPCLFCEAYESDHAREGEQYHIKLTLFLDYDEEWLAQLFYNLYIAAEYAEQIDYQSSIGFSNETGMLDCNMYMLTLYAEPWQIKELAIEFAKVHNKEILSCLEQAGWGMICTARWGSPEEIIHARRGRPLLHTEAMLALREKCKNSEEEWTKKFSSCFFEDFYEKDGVKRGDQYRIYITFNMETTDENQAVIGTLFQSVGILETDYHWAVVEDDWICYATAEEIEELVKENTDLIQCVQILPNFHNE